MNYLFDALAIKRQTIKVKQKKPKTIWALYSELQFNLAFIFIDRFLSNTFYSS